MLTLVLCVFAAFPGSAGAHGPVAPISSSFLARVSDVPAGVEAKVVDGDLRLWLRVVPSETVVVLDYRGMPYLRFSRSGVQINQNSAMYYLNQNPAQTPPPRLGRTPSWQRVTGAHEYQWHDGRLHALATVALAPGASYVGRWSIPVIVDGRLGSIAGGLWHADNPSPVWFWPILVLVMCVLAARRVHSPELDRRLARVLAVATLVAIATVAVGRGLHGRPNVSIFQLIELAIVLGFVGWGLVTVRSDSGDSFVMLAFGIAFIAAWEGLSAIPVLLKGYVLMAEPAVLARAATVVCIAGPVGLLLLTFRSYDGPRRAAATETEFAFESEHNGVADSSA